MSALLSGAVVASGLCPLLRLEVLLPAQQPLLAWIGLASALLGVLQALGESDLKRLLAWSTLSQVGLVLLQPAVGGAYALAHGLAKAGLFLASAQVPSRDLAQWGRQALPLGLGLPLLLASLSIAGAPPLLGFWTKQALEQAQQPIPPVLLLAVMVGTAAVYARLCRLPLQLSRQVPSQGALLLAGLLALAVVSPVAVPLKGSAWLKALAVLLAGALVELLLAALRRGRGTVLPQPLPSLERLPDLLGGMALVGAALLLALGFWPGAGGAAWAR
ncbi:MAG: proton-conducting transporter membrane subunit [Synechococcus sp.]